MSRKEQRYPELSRFVRNVMEAREMNVRQFSMMLWPITESRLYDVTEGRRTFDGWEVSHFHKKTGLLIPSRYLRGEDKYGRPVKHREPNQKMMEALLLETEREQ